MQLAYPATVRLSLWRPILIAVFSVVSLRYVLPPLVVGLPFGWDAVAYTKAARALLAGGDPWSLADLPVAFAGPPPSLIPFIPFVWLPDALVGMTWTILGAASAVYIIRRLGLPLWWLLFPPLTAGVCAGSLVVPTMAMMVAGGVYLQGASAAIRGYAVLPLLILGHWRAVRIAIATVVVTAPFLDWPNFIAAREDVGRALAANAEDLSATALPVLIPFALIGLVLLGRTKAAWLSVPTMWPSTQLFYGVIALPVLAEMPLVALSLAVPVPGLVVMGIAAQLLWDARSRTPTPRQSDREVVIPLVSTIGPGAHG